MAGFALSVVRSGDDVNVFADNSQGTQVVLIDNIVVTFHSFSTGWTFHFWFYEDGFEQRSGRVPVGLFRRVVTKHFVMQGPGTVHATAEYVEVNQRVKSPAAGF
ncbi:MAG: hypothetical protein L0Y66_10305 [Myxococcaceae bacterium]|nr:hypothetical protein [Myxococcaceae bacterium]